jgi:hypothetical protein
MARIRTIKPEFPQSESVGRLSRDARLLFVQLWTVVDDFGRSRAASRMLASLLFPYDDDAAGQIDGWLRELEREGHIRRYEVNGSLYLDIPKWKEHQKVDHPTGSRLPEFRDDFARPGETFAPDLGPRTKDRTKEEKICPKAENGFADQSVVGTIKSAPKRRPQYPADFEAFWLEYPTDNGMSKAEAATEWAKLSPADRQAALNGLPGFKKWVIAQGKEYRTIHAVRYLSKRRFDGFAGSLNAEWNKNLKIARELHKWDFGKWGPMPGQPGCRVPQELLAPTDGKDWTEWKSAA